MLYCNSCASISGYPQTELKEPGTCEICYNVAGKMNTMPISFEPAVHQVDRRAGFEIEEIDGFPRRQRLDFIDPGVPHKIVSSDTILFFRKDSVVLANTKSGRRIEIKFKAVSEDA